jgi:glycosyltransferase involved in cell wall biosynthesis
LFVGRLIVTKRLDVLFQACSRLPANLKPTIVVVGDGPVRGELETMALERHADTVFTGSLFGADLASQFEQADLFVLPGKGGLAIQEAMAHGLPVIVGEGDGTQGDLVRETTGWNISAGDVESLARALTEALADPVRLRRMGMDAYRVARDEVNLERMVDAFVTALNGARE